MKTTSTKLMAVVSLAVLMACSGTQNQDTQTQQGDCSVELAEDPFTLSDTNAPSLTNLNIVQANIDRYNRFWNSLQSSDTAFAHVTKVSAYTINTRDILKAHGFVNPSATSCLVKYHTRIYIGLDSSASGMNLQLYMLPVAGVSGERVDSADAGYDIAFKFNSPPPVVTSYFALELNAPCPKTCASSSRLKTGSN